jgi:acid phosphatase type 7
MSPGCGGENPQAIVRTSGHGTVVWAVGDGADGRSPAGKVVGLIERSRPDRLVYLGDVYERGTAAEYRDHYAPSWGRLAKITSPTPGNHEWPLRQEGYRPYWSKVLGRPIPDHYSFRAGGWQFLSLNSEGPHDAGSAQVRWLGRRLKGRGNCRIAFWHRPRYSAGGHGDQPDTAPLWKPLAGKVRIALWGHDHHMQRLRPRSGIVPFISGAGGHSVYPIDRSDPRLAFGNEESFGALRLDLQPGSARYRFVSTDGEVLDSGRIRCRRA